MRTKLNYKCTICNKDVFLGEELACTKQRVVHLKCYVKTYYSAKERPSRPLPSSYSAKQMRELVKWAFEMGNQTSSKKFFKEEMEKKLK